MKPEKPQTNIGPQTDHAPLSEETGPETYQEILKRELAKKRALIMGFGSHVYNSQRL